jgi:uncharacterized Zn-binding protein involved in type VI secretion
MPQINLNNIKLIVENSMRQNGFGGGDLESGWKQSITVNGNEYSNAQNLQKTRDSIAQAIYDTLTALTVTGSLSAGNNTPQSQIVAQSSTVNLNGDSSSPAAARVGDDVTISALSDPAFIAWLQAIGAYTSIPAPATVTGKISSGSNTVKIG